MILDLVRFNYSNSTLVFNQLSPQSKEISVAFALSMPRFFSLVVKPNHLEWWGIVGSNHPKHICEILLRDNLLYFRQILLTIFLVLFVHVYSSNASDWLFVACFVKSIRHQCDWIIVNPTHRDDTRNNHTCSTYVCADVSLNQTTWFVSIRFARSFRVIMYCPLVPDGIMATIWFISLCFLREWVTFVEIYTVIGDIYLWILLIDLFYCLLWEVSISI